MSDIQVKVYYDMHHRQRINLRNDNDSADIDLSIEQAKDLANRLDEAIKEIEAAQ